MAFILLPLDWPFVTFVAVGTSSIMTQHPQMIPIRLDAQTTNEFLFVLLMI